MGKQTIRKIYVVVPDGLYANLKAKMAFDGLRMSQMMRILLDAYINDNETVMKFVNDKKEELHKAYRKHAIRQREENKGKKIKGRGVVLVGWGGDGARWARYPCWLSSSPKP